MFKVFHKTLFDKTKIFKQFKKEVTGVIINTSKYQKRKIR